MREHNLALVLDVVAQHGPVSRARVAAHTGLTRGTVSSLVEELLENLLLSELAAERGGTGRPANPLQLNPHGPVGLGVEIGVDAVSACVVDLTGTVRAVRTEPSAHRTRPPADGLAHAVDVARTVVAEVGAPLLGAGVAVPGLVGRDGVLDRAPNLPGWADLDLPAAFAAAAGDLLAGLPVHVGNEADLAALAELWFGGGRADALHVSGGIGVGAGIVLGGRLFRGAGGHAGELGHAVVEPDGPSCRCGGRGCLERVAGQEALLAAAGLTAVDELLAAPGRAVPLAARSLGVALAGAVVLLDVPAVVLGGLYAHLGEPLRAAVATELDGRVGRPVEVALEHPDTGGALRAAASTAVQDRLRRPRPA